MTTGETKVALVGSEGKPGVVGQNILRLLKERGWGVNDLARAIDKRPSAVTELTKGRSRDARVETQQAMAKALGVAPDDLTLTRAELLESDRILVAFEHSEECRRLNPVYGPNDAARLRSARALIVRNSYPPRAIRFLVRQLRALHGESDWAD